MNAIILHGLPSKEQYYDPEQPSDSNDHWLPWLQNQLIIKDIKADTPEIPHAYAMNYDDWIKEVERFDIGSETIVIGHSCGGGFWVRYLSEHPELRVAKVILVAPWVNVNHEEDSDMFDFEINSGVVQQANEFVIFTSDNDFKDVQNSIQYLREKLPKARFVDFHEYGHFCKEDMGTVEFPELLEEALK